MQINFVVRSYGLQELAQLFSKLLEAGYHSGQKILTPRQVEIIIDHLGEP